jgi:Glucose-6-phosphate dehydrogenase subunit N-terminal domain/Glucose-6-phosphate dehydrogenase subunit C-terminal domain
VAAQLTSVAEVERELSRLRSLEEAGPALRTSVMTHTAWVPPEWLGAAEAVLAGLGERHPSRTIVLVPEPDSDDDGIQAEVELERFALGDQSICSEVLVLHLHGQTSRVPASIVQPLLVADLPVFLRWRGEPEFGGHELEQLVEVADRVIVDSGEWPGVPGAYGRLVPYLDRSAWSDIAWARTFEWRRVLAGLWPEIAGLRELSVVGPAAEASLLAGWLRSRLGRAVELVHETAESLDVVAVDGEKVDPPRTEARTPSDLLSDELDRFARDEFYEQAVTRAVAAT